MFSVTKRLPVLSKAKPRGEVSPVAKVYSPRLPALLKARPKPWPRMDAKTLRVPGAVNL